MNTIEKEIYVSLVEMYIEHCPDNDTDENGLPCYYPPCSAAFGAMRRNILDLELAEGSIGKSRLLVEANEVSEKLQHNFPPSAPDLYRLMSDWMDLFSGYTLLNIDYLPTTRKPFSVNVAYTPLMNLLVRDGYATKRDAQYLWTDKIGPAMQSFSQWTLDLEDIWDLEEKKLVNEAECMLTSLPCETLEWLKQQDETQLAVTISSHWTNSRWDWQNKQAINVFYVAETKRKLGRVFHALLHSSW